MFWSEAGKLYKHLSLGSIRVLLVSAGTHFPNNTYYCLRTSRRSRTFQRNKCKNMRISVEFSSVGVLMLRFFDTELVLVIRKWFLVNRC